MKRILLKIFLILTRKNIFKHYKFLKQREFFSLEENLNFQKKRLEEIVLFSYHNTKYYHKILSDFEVVVAGEVHLENFSRLPILTKEIITIHRQDMIVNADDNYTDTSGGSTGEPIKIEKNRLCWKKGMAGKWLFFSFAVPGIPFKHIKLWGSEKDFLKGTTGISGKIKNFLLKRVLLNTYRLKDNNMDEYICAINSIQPEVIEAYADSIYLLAKHIEKKKIHIYSPRAIFSSAGVLRSEMRELIEKVFKTKIYNRYGSREVGDMACNCDKTDKLHVNILDYYFEILDENLRPAAKDESGKVIITSFNNLAMPLLRYDIGDRAIPSINERCVCGRGLPLIERVEGRSCDFIETRGGRFSGTALTTSMYHAYSIKKYQFIQKSFDNILIKIVLNDESLWKKDMPKLHSKLIETLGESTKIDFEIVAEIKPSKSGKHLYFINEMDKI